MKLPAAAYSAEVAASATKAGSGSIRLRRIKSRAATAKQSDSPCVRQGDIVWLGAVGAAGLFVERWSENKEGTQQAQPLVTGAGGRDRTGMDLVGPRDFKTA
jgi:hypothetical protein